MELRVSKNENIWVAKHRPVFSAITGQVLALELDYNRTNNDTNQVFLVDQTPSVLNL